MMNIPLNLPILPYLKDSKNILIAGAGGGFDLYTGLPIYYELKQMGKSVHLANYSFSDTRLVAKVTDSEVIYDDLLVGTRGAMKMPLSYSPEAYLAEWFREIHGQEITIWAIEKVGVPLVKKAYEALVEHLSIDTIILVDGGVDSLMHGDEEGAGTYLEDTISVTAVTMLKTVRTKILAAVGMGTEVEETVCHYLALQNIAALAKDGAYYGSCSLIPQMPAFEFYKQAASYVFKDQHHEASRIQSRLIPAVWGEFGAYNWLNHPRQPHNVFHSPLMSLYWFFDAVKVNERSLIVEAIRDKETFREAVAAVMSLELTPRRHRQSIPLL